MSIDTVNNKNSDTYFPVQPYATVSAVNTKFPEIQSQEDKKLYASIESVIKYYKKLSFLFPPLPETSENQAHLKKALINYCVQNNTSVSFVEEVFIKLARSGELGLCEDFLPEIKSSITLERGISAAKFKGHTYIVQSILPRLQQIK